MDTPLREMLRLIENRGRDWILHNMCWHVNRNIEELTALEIEFIAQHIERCHKISAKIFLRALEQEAKNDLIRKGML